MLCAGKGSNMSSRIALYYKNATAGVLGADHGVTDAELKGLEGQIAEITERMDAERQAGNLPYRELPYQEHMRQQVVQLADKLRPRYDNLVVMGIGGSALGNLALQTALNIPTYNLLTDRAGPRLFVIDNVDPVQFGSLLAYLEDQLDRTLFNVVSKSGQTAETAAQFLTVCALLEEKLPSGALTEHIVATTDAQGGTLRRIVERQGFESLEVPDGVGGRFSVLSAVGLFSAAMCGIDVGQLAAGAGDMDQRVSRPQLRQNPAALYAAIQYCLYRKGKSISVMMPYSYQLKDLGDWYRQLWAESLGKQIDLQGNVVNVGPTPVKALGTTDQHSQVQLYREGPNDKVFTFLAVEKFAQDVTIGPAGQAAELEYLAGASMNKLINSEKSATEYALVQSERPCLTVQFDEISAATVGQFIYMFEVATSYMGALLNINTYDQPAVELGKKATFALMGHSDYAQMCQEIRAACRVDRDYLV